MMRALHEKHLVVTSQGQHAGVRMAYSSERPSTNEKAPRAVPLPSFSSLVRTRSDAIRQRARRRGKNTEDDRSNTFTGNVSRGPKTIGLEVTALQDRQNLAYYLLADGHTRFHGVQQTVLVVLQVSNNAFEVALWERRWGEKKTEEKWEDGRCAHLQLRHATFGNCFGSAVNPEGEAGREGDRLDLQLETELGSDDHSINSSG